MTPALEINDEPKFGYGGWELGQVPGARPSSMWSSVILYSWL